MPSPMSNSKSPCGDALKARAYAISRATEIVAGLAGTSMALLGLISISQAAFSGKDFSIPQIVQGLIGILATIGAANGWLKRSLTTFLLDSKNQRVISLLPIVASWSIILYRIILPNKGPAFKSYLRTISEGSIVEWASFIILIASSLLLLKAAIRWENSGARWLLFTGAAGIFIIGMEEMSWGQMIFNWETPELFNDYNVQHETGLHNLWFIHYQTWTIAAILMSITFILSTIGGLIRHASMMRPRSIAEILLPLGCTASYFLVASVIYWCTVLEKTGIDLIYFHTREQELGELFFYSGMFIHSMHLYFESPQARKSESRSLKQANRADTN